MVKYNGVEKTPEELEELRLESENKRFALLKACLKRCEPAGKVREIYKIPGHPNLLAIYVTDRISARDFVFDFTIPEKGVILNLITVSWKRELEKAGIKTDLVVYGKHVDEYLPVPLRGDHELWKRLTIVHRCDMIDRECIVRLNRLGSSATKPNMTVCGHRLTARIRIGAEFKKPLFTPTTKAKIGHDLNRDFRKVRLRYPGLEEFVTGVVSVIRDKLQQRNRIRILDTKFEIGRDADGSYRVCDEVATPDSSRFCREQDYEPLTLSWPVAFLDKEYFRKAVADALGLRDLDPNNRQDRAHVLSLPAPKSEIAETKRRYLEAFEGTLGYDNTADYLFAAWGISPT